jgi:hypothetical protein
LKRGMEVLMAAMASREKELATRERLPDKIDKLTTRWRASTSKSVLAHIFRGWKRAIASQREIRVVRHQ